MAVSEVAGTGVARVESILGDDASLLAARVQDHSEGAPAPARRRLRRASALDLRPVVAGARQPAEDVRAPADSPDAVTCRSCRSIRVSSTPPAHRSRRIIAYFDPENIVKLAIEGGCNAVASTLGVLGAVSKKYADRIPFIVKLNHNEFLSYPNSYDQILFGSVKQAVNMGALGVGATIYFGSPESKRQIQEVSAMFQEAHERGLFTVLWCYTRNAGFQDEGRRLPPCGRPHRPGQSSRRDDRGRHHQAEAARGVWQRFYDARTSARRTRRSTRS